MTSVLTLNRKLSVLALGPHADDVELGCGATLLYLKKVCKAKIHYVVFSDHYFEKDEKKDRKREIENAKRMLGVDTFYCWSFNDTKFPDEWREIQNRIAKLREEFKPDLIFAPRLNDNHQDHVTIAQAATREFRHGQAIWHYEIKQFGQDHFDANLL